MSFSILGSLIFSLLIAVDALLFSSRALAAGDVVLSIGHSTEVALARESRVDVANGAIVHVTDLGHTMKIVGLKIGRTAVHVRTSSGLSDEVSVQVLPETSYHAYSVLHGALEAKRGLKITVDGEQILIHGHLLRFADWRAIAAAARGLSPRTFQFAAELDDATRAQARAFFAKEFSAMGLPRLELTFQPVATVSVPTDAKEMHEHAEKSLAPYGIHVVGQPLAVSLEPLIRVQILVAEFRKSFSSQFGIKWPSAAAGQLLPSPQFAPGENLTLSLQALESSGAAKVLASPTLLCRSGKEAKFLAGGEFPIKIANFKTQDVIWKQYGVLLHISPRANASGHMSIAITTEVSMIDKSRTVDGVPGLLTNRIETHFDLASSRTIALSGLIKHEWGNSVEGLPELSRLPILGPLFSSRAYEENETELVIFVTPAIEPQSTEEAI